MICGSGGSKSRLAKAAGAEPAGQMRDEKLHAVVARSTFASQNVQNPSASDRFWKLRCRNSRCGAKHICKWKCTKHTIVGPFLEVAMSKKCTPLLREAHFEVKMHKTHQLRKLRCRKSACRCGAKHISKSKCYIPLDPPCNFPYNIMGVGPPVHRVFHLWFCKEPTLQNHILTPKDEGYNIIMEDRWTYGKMDGLDFVRVPDPLGGCQNGPIFKKNWRDLSQFYTTLGLVL